MIAKVLFPLCFLIFCFQAVFSQQLSGRVIYRASNQIMIRIDSADMSPDEIAEAHEIMQKPWQRDFILTFAKTESNWRQIETLDGASSPSADQGLTISLSGSGNEILYKNLANTRYVQEQEFMGKEFLIQDDLEPINWQLMNETKRIGDYMAQKAIFNRLVEVHRFSSEMVEMESGQDTLQIEAWFTPDIPVSHGPENYYGLPGLILEIHNGGRSYYFQKIELNPDSDQIVIQTPIRGKIVTRKAFEAMQEESIKQMNNRYQGKQGEGSKIRIGG